MSLKLRLLLSIAASLALALLLGGAILCWQARASVRDELRVALQGAKDEVSATLANDTRRPLPIGQIVSGFEGQRHVRAFLVDGSDRVIQSSMVATVLHPAPDWFAKLIAPPPLTVRLAIPQADFPNVLLLKSDAGNELGEIWGLARDAFGVIALFSAILMLSVWLLINRSLHFFRNFQQGLRTISDGEYDARLATRGPPEFAALADGFNHMAARLSSYRKSNRRLQQQIMGLQEEERAELARDLHDEVGPYLFAIQVDADAVAKAGDEAARERAGAIREAALHIQQHVKYILRQLRPVSGLDFGLETAIDDLIAFWKRRHPDITFNREIFPDVRMDRRREEAAYRIVQESVSNAVRHGRPSSITIMLINEKDGVAVSVEDNGSGFAAGGSSPTGMGLKGMAERVSALNGQFTVQNSANGVTVRAVLPPADVRETEDA